MTVNELPPRLVSNPCPPTLSSAHRRIYIEITGHFNYTCFRNSNFEWNILPDCGFSLFSCMWESCCVLVLCCNQIGGTLNLFGKYKTNYCLPYAYTFQTPITIL
jgi:hypothetical protein